MEKMDEMGEMIVPLRASNYSEKKSRSIPSTR